MRIGASQFSAEARAERARTPCVASFRPGEGRKSGPIWQTEQVSSGPEIGWHLERARMFETGNRLPPQAELALLQRAALDALVPAARGSHRLEETAAATSRLAMQR